MPGNFEKEDLRVIKTKKNLSAAMWTILSSRSFNKITVNDLCDEALVSRAAFYIHYKDKYDLLRQCLLDSAQDFLNKSKTCSEEQREDMITCFVNDNKKIIMNLSENSDSELFNILSDFSMSFINSLIKGNDSIRDPDEKKDFMLKNKKTDIKNTSLYTFCAGGALEVLIWQSKKKFPHDEKSAIIYIYRIIKLLLSNINEIEYN